MYPSRHFFWGIIFAGILWIIAPNISWLGFAIILTSTVLIDFDHYLLYVVKKKDLNLRNCYYWYQQKMEKFFALPKQKRKEYYGGFFIFHGFEILLLLDLISDLQLGTSSYKLSLAYNLYKSKRMKHFKDL